MSVATAVQRLLQAGFSIDQALEAAAIFEEEMRPANQQDGITARQARNARYYERKASEKRLKASESLNSDVSDGERLNSDDDGAKAAPASRAHVVNLSSELEERTIPSVCQESPAPSRPKPLDLKSHFLGFWTAYPQRDGANPRKPAEDKFAAAVRSGAAPEQIIAAAERYADECRGNGKAGTSFVAQAVTWLNQRRFQDYAAPPADAGKSSVPEPPRPGLPTHEELLARYSRPANAAPAERDTDSPAVLRDGNGIHREIESRRPVAVPSDQAGRSGVVRLGDVLPPAFALDASGDADGSSGRHPFDDSSLPVAGMAGR